LRSLQLKPPRASFLTSVRETLHASPSLCTSYALKKKENNRKSRINYGSNNNVDGREVEKERGEFDEPIRKPDLILIDGER
jgi:hypothetical protein